jgi:Na+/pantothenate symporter
MHSYTQNLALYGFVPYIYIQFAGVRACLLNDVFAITILGVIARVHLALSVIILPK